MVTGSNDYERGINRLITRVKSIHEIETGKEWSSTKQKKDIEKIALELEKAAKLLAVVGTAQFDIEIFHDERGSPKRIVGLDGWPVEEKSPIDWPSYKSIYWNIRVLAESANLAAQQLPNPRKKRALEFAAHGLLHLRNYYDFPLPKLSDTGTDVQELKRVCESAGMCLSVERYRGMLSESLKSFDPHYMESYCYELFQ